MNQPLHPSLMERIPKIPQDYYRRAAEIMPNLPEVDFMHIVFSLYEEDKLKKAKQIADSTVAPMDSEDLPLGMAWNIPTSSENPNNSNEAPAKPQKPKRTKHMRKQRRTIVANDAFYEFASLAALFKYFSIPHEAYRNVSSCASYLNKDIVKTEAGIVKSIMKDSGIPVSKYSAYDFDGNFQTVEFNHENA